MRSLLGTLLAAAFLALALAFLTGCETMRVGFTTDFGTFSYELPKPRPGK